MVLVAACLNTFFFQAEDGIRDLTVTGVQTCALPIFAVHAQRRVPVPRFDYFVAGRLEHDADRAPQQRVVVDDQDARHRAATRPARPAPGARAPPARKASGGRRPRTRPGPRTPTRTAPSSRTAAATAARPAAARSTPA